MKNNVTPTIKMALIKFHKLGPMTNTALAKEMGMPLDSVGKILVDMRRCNLIKSEKGKYDSRETINSLTPSGESHAILAFTEVETGKITSKLDTFHVFPTDEEEQKFLEMIKKFGKEVAEMVSKMKGKRS